MSEPNPPEGKPPRPLSPKGLPPEGSPLNPRVSQASTGFWILIGVVLICGSILVVFRPMGRRVSNNVNKIYDEPGEPATSPGLRDGGFDSDGKVIP